MPRGSPTPRLCTGWLSYRPAAHVRGSVTGAAGWASARATSAATAALCSRRATLAAVSRPADRRAAAASSAGVRALPRTPATSPSAVARIAATSSGGTGFGGGTASRTALVRPSARATTSSRATVAGESTRRWTGRPDDAEPRYQHAARLEPLERRRQIEDRLRARTDHDGARRGQRGDIFGHIDPARMHPADAAGGAHRDPRHRADMERRAHGCPASLAQRHGGRKVTPSELDHPCAACQPTEIVRP